MFCDAGVAAALLVAAEVRGAGIVPADAERRAQAGRRRQREGVHVQRDRHVGGDAAGRRARCPCTQPGGALCGHVVLDEDRLLLAGRHVDGEGVARLAVDLVDGGDHRVGPAAGGALRCWSGVVTLYKASRKTRTSPPMAARRRGRCSAIGGDGDALGARGAAVDHDVEGFELVARGFERDAGGGAGGVAGTDLLRPGATHTDCARAEVEASERASDESNGFDACIGGRLSSAHASERAP